MTLDATPSSSREPISRRRIIVSSAAGGAALLLGPIALPTYGREGKELAYAVGYGKFGQGRVACTSYSRGVAQLGLKIGKQRPVPLLATVDSKALARVYAATQTKQFGLTVTAGRTRLICDGVRKSAKEIGLSWGEGTAAGEVIAYDMGIVTGTVIIVGLAAIVSLGAMAMGSGSSVEIEAETSEGDSVTVRIEGGGDGGEDEGD